jgi:hypothetical protein
MGSSGLPGETINEKGLTLKEWLKIAGLDHSWFVGAAYMAWQRGEDPQIYGNTQQDIAS